MKLKLCYLLPQYDNNSAENFYHIINFLEELGKKVDLYLIIENCNSKPEINNMKEIYIINENVKYNYSKRFYKIVKIYFKLYKRDVKIFFSRASFTGVFPLVIANKFLNLNRANIVFWSCGQDKNKLTWELTKKNIIRNITSLLNGFIFKNINFLATGPERMVEYYSNYYGVNKNKIIMLFNDISLERFNPLSVDNKKELKEEFHLSNKKVILFVHTFNYARGTDLLPKIALQLKEKNINAVILAIGREGDYSLILENKIKELEINDYLLKVGTIANKDIVKYYQMSDLFIMPSRGEGFPRVLIESMACSVPCISFNVGGVLDILPEKILENCVVEVEDEASFIKKTIKIISNENLLKRYSELSYKKVQEYNTSKVVDMYISKLSKI